MSEGNGNGFSKFLRTAANVVLIAAVSGLMGAESYNYWRASDLNTRLTTLEATVPIKTSDRYTANDAHRDAMLYDERYRDLMRRIENLETRR